MRLPGINCEVIAVADCRVRRLYKINGRGMLPLAVYMGGGVFLGAKEELGAWSPEVGGSYENNDGCVLPLEDTQIDLPDSMALVGDEKKVMQFLRRTFRKLQGGKS